MKTKIYRLPNGGSVVYTRNRKLRQTIAQIGFIIREIRKKDFGVAHFVEHMCLKGTKKAPEYEKYNLAKSEICPNLNGSTSISYVTFNFSRTNKMLAPTIDFIANSMFNSTFDKERIEKEKDVILKERLRSVDEREANVQIVNRQTIADTKSKIFYSADALLGSEKDIKNITRRKLLNYKEKLYTKNNFFCCATSSLPARKFISLIDNKIYTNLPEDKSQYQKPIEYVINKKSQVKLYSHNRTKFSYMLSFVCDWDYEKNYNNFTPLCTATILQKAFYQALRKLGFVYEFQFKTIKYDKQIHVYCHVETTKENFESTLNILIKEIKKTQEKVVNDKVINDTIQNLIFTEDEAQPISYTLSNNIRLFSFLEHDKIYPSISWRKRRKLISQFNAEKMRSFCKYIFNTENVYLTVLGKDLNKKDYPTIKKLKNMLKLKVNNDEN